MTEMKTFSVRSIGRTARHFLRERRASTAVVFALTLVPMVLAAGGAVDFTRYYDARAALQSALDASVLAGSTADNDEVVANTTFSSWNVSIDGSVGSPSFTTGGSGSASHLTGQVTAHLNMYFTPLVGISTLTLNLSAKAERTLSEGTGDVCLLATNPTEAKSLTVNGSGVINAPGCDIYVQSASDTAATIDGTILSNKLCFIGDIRTNVTPDNVYTGGVCPAVSDPYAGKLPAADIGTCQYIGPFNPGTHTLTPGTYCGGVNFNGRQTVTFSPGLYVLKGGPMLFAPGTYVGEGVTFYLADSSSYLQLNSDSVTQFSAPASGTYEGILIYEAENITGPLEMTVNGTKNWSGLIHLPSRQMVLNGSSVMVANSRMVVVNQITVNGELDLSGGVSDGTENTYSVARLVE